jgi:hypothetical protein
MTESDSEVVLTDQLAQLQAFAPLLHGTGVEAQTAFRSVVGQASAMDAASKAAAATIAQVAANDALPGDHRIRVIHETREKAQAQLHVQKQAATISAHILEAALKAAIVPATAANPVDRQLARQTVHLTLEGVPKEGRIEALRGLLGRSPVVDAEILSDSFGYGLVGHADWEPFKTIAVETLIQKGGHDARAQAAVKALTAFRGDGSGKVAARVGGIASLSALRLRP